MRQPRKWVLFFALAIMLMTSLPYLVGFAVQGDGWVFSGFVIGVEDGNSYLAKMLTGTAGSWLFRSPYSAYPQNGVVAYLLYLLLGKLAAAPGLHIQLVVLYHLFRLGAGILAILATYDFLAIFLRRETSRRFGLMLAILGGGAGWFLILLGKEHFLGTLPLDFYSPETFGFLSLFGIPHLALARAALLWSVVIFLRRLFPEDGHSQPGIEPEGADTVRMEAMERGQDRLRRVFTGPSGDLCAAVKIGGLWLILALAQPASAVLLGGLFCLFLLTLAIRLLMEKPRNSNNWSGWKRGFRIVILSGLIPAPFLAYTALSFWLDPYLQAWTAQNRILSPHPLHYLFAYGLILPFAIPGARGLMAEQPWRGIFPVSWALSLPVLAYAPFNLQRRLPEGIWVALCIMTITGLDAWREKPSSPAGKIKGSLRPVFPVILLVLAFPSTLLLLFGGLQAALRPSPPVFRPAEEVQAFEFLAGEVQFGDVVLSAFETGNALPAWAPVRVLIGHGSESAALEKLSARTAEFYGSQTSDAERIALLKQFQVRYVFWGPQERALGDWRPDSSSYLKEVYRDGEYAIYQVSP